MRFVYFDNHHLHNSNAAKSTEEAHVLNYLAQMLSTHTADEAKLLAKTRFNISASRMSYIWGKYTRAANFNVVSTYLHNSEYLTRVYQGAEVDIPELFLAVSPSMRAAYSLFGDVLCLDVTYNLLKQRTSERKRQWGVGVFVGMGKNMELVIFGWCLISN